MSATPTTSSPTSGETVLSSLVASYQNTLSSVSTKAVLSQLALMSVLGLGTLLAFSLLRPENKRVYAPKIKYIEAIEGQDGDDPNTLLEPPPDISKGFFDWLKPVLKIHEQDMLTQIGLDGCTFLRVQRLLSWMFLVVSILVGCVLLPINIVYNMKRVDRDTTNTLALLTIQNLSGSILWAHVTASYVIIGIIMFFIWYHWKKMILLRQAWFRSEGYQSKIYSRTLMITGVPKQFRTDQGLIQMISQLKVDGIKIGAQIDCTSIGRQLGEFPELVKQHNETVRNLEESLVHYLKGGKMASKRPHVTKGGFMCLGGQSHDAIEYYSKKVKHLRDKIDIQRAEIEAMIRQDRSARKKGREVRPRGENFGFVTLKTISEAHRIARSHRGKLKELGGAEITLAPPSQDLVWENIKLEPAARRSRVFMGFFYIAVVCFFNTIPLAAVSVLANLATLTVLVPQLDKWRNAGNWGNWTFSIVSGVLPSLVSLIFGYLLPLIMRKISKYQGAMTKSRLDRAVIARYFAFMIISNFLIFSLIGVVYTSIVQIVVQAGEGQSFAKIMESLSELPNQIQASYVQQSTYWLTVFPLRGFLAIFEIAQLIKLGLLSIQKLLFAKTPRDIKEKTKPPYFDYDIVLTNFLFLGGVAMIYAPLAPLVCIGCTIVFWISTVIYKYQLLYVYVSRAESGGRLYNVVANRILACGVFMQLLMILTIGLSRRKWTDVIATCPPLLIMIIFKFVICRPLEKQFRYYIPTPQEAEAEWQHAMSEKRLHHSEMERRFLHPALYSHELFTVMVHKSQEQLARQVLSEYTWFSASGKGDSSAIAIKAVRPENLEYDATRDGTRTEVGDFDTQSIASTDALADGKSEIGVAPHSVHLLKNYLDHGPVGQSSTTVGYNPTYHGSKDNLLENADHPGQWSRQASYQHGNGFDDVVDGERPLYSRQASDMAYQQTPPFPPTSYQGGYDTAPLMTRTDSERSQPELYVEPYIQGQQQPQYQSYEMNERQSPPQQPYQGYGPGNPRFT